MEVKIDGMHCNSCVMIIREALEDNGAKNVKVAVGKASFEGIDQKKAKQLIEAEGYKVK